MKNPPDGKNKRKLGTWGFIWQQTKLATLAIDHHTFTGAKRMCCGLILTVYQRHRQIINVTAGTLRIRRLSREF